MDFEITEWKLPADMVKLVRGLDAYVAIIAKKGGHLYLYDSDYQKVKRLAKANLPATAMLDRVTYRGIEVFNGGTKKSKRPAPHYNPDRIKLR